MSRGEEEVLREKAEALAVGHGEATDNGVPPLHSLVLGLVRSLDGAPFDVCRSAVSDLLLNAPFGSIADVVCRLSMDVIKNRREEHQDHEQSVSIASWNGIQVTPTSPITARNRDAEAALRRLPLRADESLHMPPTATSSADALHRLPHRSTDDSIINMPNFVDGSLMSFVEDTANVPQSTTLMPPSHARGSPVMNASIMTMMNRSAVVVTRGETLDSVNDFEFIHQIGQGAQATVWLCVDVRTGEERAVKVIDRSNCADADAESGLVEIEAAMRLQHDNVIRLYEVIDDPSAQAVFLVMEYVEDGASGTVSESGECATRYSVAQVTELAAGAALGLQYCHDRGVVHGDIKPENLLVSTDEATRALRAVLADFGVAKLIEAFSSSAKLGNKTSTATTHMTSDQGRRVSHSTAHTAADLSNEQMLMSHNDPMFMSHSGDTNSLFPTLLSPPPPPPPPGQQRDSGGGAGSSRTMAHLSTDKPPLVPPPPYESAPLIISDTLPFTGADAPPNAARRGSRRISLSSPAPFVPAPPPLPPSSPSFDRRLSLRDVGRVLADKTRTLVRMLTDEEKCANFAKRGPRTFGGTPAFQAPELLDGGHPTPASDMWALGVTLYALIFKRLPWHGATWFELKESVFSNPVPFPVTSVADRDLRRWRGVLERLLDKDPKTRMCAADLRINVLSLLRFSSNSPSTSPAAYGSTPSLSMSTVAVLLDESTV